MLNRTKGPAMHSPRAQADKKLYQFTMKHRVEAQPNLTLRQEMVEGLVLIEESCERENRSRRLLHAASSASWRAATRSIAPRPSS